MTNFYSISVTLPSSIFLRNRVNSLRMKVRVGGESRRQDVGRSGLSSHLLASSHRALHYLYLTGGNTPCSHIIIISYTLTLSDIRQRIPPWRVV